MPGKMVWVRNTRKVAGTKDHWPEKKKLEAVTTYLALGNYKLTSAQCGIPYDTILAWKRSEWWADLVKEVQAQEDQVMDSKLSRILEKSLAAVNDRILNGEYMYDPKTGGIKRVPVKLKDVHKVTTDLIDKQRLIRKQPTRIVQSEGQEDKLQQLAEAFTKFALGQKVIEPEVHEQYIESENVEKNEEGIYEVKE